MPPKKGDPAFFAVHRGFRPGVYLTWDECERYTKGFPNAKFKKFPTREQAEDFVRGVEPSSTISTAPPTQASASTSTHTSTTIARTEPSKTVDRATMSRFASDALLLPPGAPEDGYLVVYSDGASKGNGQPGSVAGVGVWWGPNDPRNIAERCPGDQTNNCAELIAILRVLEETPVTPEQPLLIKSDSKYSMDCFDKWIKGWKRNNWRTSDGQPVKNAGIIRLIDAHLARRARLNHTVRFKYVKGHSGDIGNNGADAQANLGVMLPLVPDRDWDAAIDALITEQAMADEGVEIELPAPATTSRKRSRSPPRNPSPSKTASSSTTVQSPKTPSRNTAARIAAIEQALNSPLEGQPPAKVRVVTPPPDQPLFEPQSAARQPQTPRRTPAGKSTRLADLEAGLAEISSPTKSSSSRAKTPMLQTAAGSSTSDGTLQRRGMSSNAELTAEDAEYRKYPVRVIVALPPLVPVKKEEVDFDDYEDCLLSDDELANEI